MNTKHNNYVKSLVFKYTCVTAIDAVVFSYWCQVLGNNYFGLKQMKPNNNCLRSNFYFKTIIVEK